MTALRIVFLALAVGVLGLLGWRSMAGHPAPVATARQAPPNVATLASAMRAAPAPTSAPVPALAPVSPSRPASDPIGEVPEFAGFYGRLKVDFPRDYSAILDHLGRDGSMPPADAAIWDALRDLEQSKGILAAQAGPAALDRFFDARSALLAGLAPLDAHRCVDFLYGMTDASIAGFTAAHHGLVATLADRMLDAITEGRSHPGDRAAPSAADLDAVSTGLAAFGLAPAEIGLLIDGTTPDPPLSDKRVCEIGRTYLDVLHGLPADARQRVYGLAAELLARS
ncbi:MAG: hypothetical protein ACRYGP_07915, partial [Janthinobacterium lividum]